MICKILETDKEFALTLPLIYKMVEDTKSLPFVQCSTEVANAILQSDTFLTVVAYEEEVIGYICGYFVGKHDFLISHAYCKRPEVTMKLWGLMECEGMRKGALRFMLHTSHNPRLFHRYGFKMERYFMKKEV